MARSKKSNDDALSHVGDNAGKRLAAFIHRIEKIDEERRGLGDDRKEVLAEAVGIGFDRKIINTIIKLRKMDRDDRDEQEQMIDTYERAIASAERQGDDGDL